MANRYKKQGDKAWNPNETIFHYDDDDYNEDGTLKKDVLSDYTGSFYDDDGYYQGYGQSSLFDYDYESYSKTNGASSSWWRSKFRKSDYRSINYYPNQEVDPQAELNAKLSQDLKEIARTVNAVRNTKGALNRERNLKVAWSGSVTRRYGRNEFRGSSANNTSNSSTIHLSPDPLTPDSKIKPDWSEDQRRDALIGEALTLTSMKKTLQPVNVKKITEYEIEDEVIKDLPLMERSEQEKAKLRIIARELWKSLETYKAQAEMLQEYRGSRAYFSAYLAFYSDKTYRDQVQEMMDSFANEELEDDDVSHVLGPALPSKTVSETLNPKKYKKSMVAAHALSWNVNHANINNDQVEPKTEEMEDVMIEAFDILMNGVDMRSTFQRWETAVEAAEILNTLDLDDDGEEGEGKSSDEENGQSIQDSLAEGSNNKNGNSDNLFGKPVDNESEIQGTIDCNELDDAKDEDAAKGLTDLSSGTEFIEESISRMENEYKDRRPNWQDIDAEWDKVIQRDYDDLSEDRVKLQRSLRYLRQLVEPYAELISLPEYGLRSGRLSGNALWKVPTQLLDNDRVFHRNHVQGDTQNVSIALLMDYSGSMGGNSYCCQRQLAMLLHDLFSDFPMVDFHMYGHEAWHTNRIYGLSSIETVYHKKPHGGTNEGTALARTASEFLASSPKKNRKILLTMGDGCSNQEDIKKSIKMIRKSGMEVYDILIDGNFELASEAYGAGKAVTVASSYYNKASSSINFDEVGITELTPDEDLIQAQVISILRPWLASIFSRMQNMGSI